jgi:hypothetical protein
MFFQIMSLCIRRELEGCPRGGDIYFIIFYGCVVGVVSVMHKFPAEIWGKECSVSDLADVQL